MRVSAPIAPAVVGDFVPPLFTFGPGHVNERCESPTPLPGSSFGCLSCSCALANQYQLDPHLEIASDQPHVIAKLCAVHGWETL